MDTTRYLSSQRYRNEETVAAKQAAKDYVVHYVVAVVDGDEYRLVCDGHHSYEAAKRDGVEPTYLHSATSQAAVDHSVEDYMAQAWIDADWYDLATGRCEWQ